MDFMTATDPSKAPAHFNLGQLSAVLLDRKNIPIGFFVSQKLWDAIEARWRHESGSLELGPAPQTFHGTKIAVDPSMAETEFDVAFTEDAWSKRLREISLTPQSPVDRRPSAGKVTP